ncbi:4'-phosphopantetheinyl transferase superfamily protein [Streptomyces sp. NPDC091371]|uniref:4'-phosphopantetheinyl transferase family protein n=1 Tax=Streptomyces sp. NPDC091371 TaxID=3155303 RepID=UPI003438C7E7
MHWTAADPRDVGTAPSAVRIPWSGCADAELWLVRPSGPPGTAELAVLDAAERRRAASFRRPARAEPYIAAHVALRRLLGERLGVLPEDVALRREAGGRPVLAGHPPALHFSLSHSGGVALLGIAGQVIGVDVQRLPGASTVELCGGRLHPAEQAELHARPAADRPEHFARLWARKEAYLKGLGTGLRRPLDADYLGDGGAGCPARPVGWTVRDVPCEPGFAAAVAVLTSPIEQ